MELSGEKYEFQTETNESHFEVRNARFSVSAMYIRLLPISEIDLSDEGSIKMLDAYARVFRQRPEFYDWSMRTFHNRRSPFTHQQYFANRSFIAKQVGNVRDVGLTSCYTKEGFLFLEGDCLTAPVWLIKGMAQNLRIIR